MTSSMRDLLARKDFFDAAILWHGFTDYMRDYEIIVGARNGPPNTDVHRYQFIGCVAAMCTTALHPAPFIQSLPDQFVYAGLITQTKMTRMALCGVFVTLQPIPALPILNTANMRVHGHTP